MTAAMMIDLETLHTNKRAIVLQAGWCFFDPEGDGVAPLTREMNVNIDSCVRAGGAISDGTFRWWLDQSEEARKSVARPGVDIAIVLSQLAQDYRENNCRSIWSNGSCFDIVIVEHYWEKLDRGETPWKFWDIRDTRTVWATAEKFAWKRNKGAVAHTAAADAVAQAIQVQAANRWIREKVRG